MQFFKRDRWDRLLSARTKAGRRNQKSTQTSPPHCKIKYSLSTSTCFSCTSQQPWCNPFLETDSLSLSLFVYLSFPSSALTTVWPLPAHCHHLTQMDSAGIRHVACITTWKHVVAICETMVGWRGGERQFLRYSLTVFFIILEGLATIFYPTVL